MAAAAIMLRPLRRASPDRLAVSKIFLSMILRIPFAPFVHAPSGTIHQNHISSNKQESTDSSIYDLPEVNVFFLFLDPNDAPAFSDGLARFESALDLIRQVDPIMPIGAAASLVHIARRLPGLYGGSISLGDVAREMELNYATFMRNADLLSEGGANVRQLNLLEKGMSPNNKRARQFKLSDKGLGLLQQIDEVISGREGSGRP